MIQCCYFVVLIFSALAMSHSLKEFSINVILKIGILKINIY